MQTTTTTGLLDLKTRGVLQAFAGCLLIPVRPGLNPDSVPVPLAEEAASNSYRARLAVDSVAVVLGGRSDGLFAMEFDNEAEFQAFLARNPDSRETLITSHRGRPVVWHRAKTPHGASLRLHGMTVLMTGCVLVLDRGGLRCFDSIVHSASPTMVNLETLDWGPDPTGTVDVWLTTALQGELFRPGLHGGLITNRAVWRSYLVRRLRPLLMYERLERRFYTRSQANDWQPVAENAIRPWLRELIMAAPAGTATARAAITDPWLDRLVQRLKSLLPAGPRILHARLQAFARDCVKVEPGRDLTVGELHRACVAWCEQNELPVVPEEVFQKHICAVLRGDPWFRSKSKSVVRSSGFQNGFRSLALRRPVGISRRSLVVSKSGRLG